MRVIAGSRRGSRLVAPATARPTTDRVREALFSALGPDPVEDAAVLDLYAGSGALAIEALSRGASRAVLVDNDRAAAEACMRNLESTRLSESARVRTGAVDRFVAGGPPAEAPFDLVFVDAPYDLGAPEVAAAVRGLAGPGWLAADARVVVERPAADGIPAVEGFEPTWERRYGDTLVVVLALTDD